MGTGQHCKSGLAKKPFARPLFAQAPCMIFLTLSDSPLTAGAALERPPAPAQDTQRRLWTYKRWSRPKESPPGLKCLGTFCMHLPPSLNGKLYFVLL